MPLFRFQTVHVGGRKSTGVIEADSLAAAKDRLRLEHMLVTDLVPYLEVSRKFSIPFIQLLDITRMLGQLQGAGIPLVEALVIVEEKYRQMSFHPLLVDLCDRVKNGQSLSIALSQYTSIFDSIYIAMIKAGEESGSLMTSFQQLTSLLEDKDRLKKQLISATVYPIFLGSFCIVIFLSLLIWIIPSLKNLFEERALHPLTHFIFHLSDFFLDHYFLVIVSLITFVFLAILITKNNRLKPYRDRLFLKCPLIGPTILLAATVRFCRTCSLLLKGGTPLLYTLQLAKDVLKNKSLEQQVTVAEKNVSEGASLSQQTDWMPSLVSRMLAVGEKTGQIASMLSHISTLCEEDLNRTLRRYTSILQPLLLLILGLLIGMVLLSILIPLTDVSSMLQG